MHANATPHQIIGNWFVKTTDNPEGQRETQVMHYNMQEHPNFIQNHYKTAEIRPDHLIESIHGGIVQHVVQQIEEVKRKRPGQVGNAQKVAPNIWRSELQLL